MDKNMNKRTRVSFGDIFSKFAIIIIFVVLIVFFSFSAPNFAASTTFINILRQCAVVGIAAVGMTFVLITGGIDLSVGSIIGVGVVSASLFMAGGAGSFAACLLALIIAAGCGFLNGFFICYLKIPPFIATLGTMTSIRGLGYILTGGLPVFGFSETYAAAGQSYVGPLPVMVLIMIAVFVGGFVLLSTTKFGRCVYGVGCNEEATRLSGINVKKIKMFVYGLAGLLAGIAGLIMLARVNSGQPNAGTGYEMDVITGCVLGGASLSGGQGNIGFVAVGVLIMGVLSTGLVMMGVNEYVQQVIEGLVLIGAVAMDMAIKSRKSKVVQVTE